MRKNASAFTVFLQLYMKILWCFKKILGSLREDCMKTARRPDVTLEKIVLGLFDAQAVIGSRM